MSKKKKLRGCSRMMMPDGTMRVVRDYDGVLQIPEEEWKEYQQKVGERLSAAVNELLAARPELKTALGIAPDEYEKRITIMDILGDGS